MSTDKETGYDVAVIKQIVNTGHDVVERTVNALVPGATVTEDTKRAARAVLEKLFDDDEIRCPACNATIIDAENYCIGSGCPVSVD